MPPSRRRTRQAASAAAEQGAEQGPGAERDTAQELSQGSSPARAPTGAPLFGGAGRPQDESSKQENEEQDQEDDFHDDYHDAALATHRLAQPLALGTELRPLGAILSQFSCPGDKMKVVEMYLTRWVQLTVAASADCLPPLTARPSAALLLCVTGARQGRRDGRGSRFARPPPLPSSQQLPTFSLSGSPATAPATTDLAAPLMSNPYFVQNDVAVVCGLLQSSSLFPATCDSSRACTQLHCRSWWARPSPTSSGPRDQASTWT